MNFYDQATIKVKAGDGGNGVVSFLHTRSGFKGGPDGGDGGNGGSVIFKVDHQLNTLNPYVQKKTFGADNGKPGERAKRHGKAGNDLVLTVPQGTVVFHLLVSGKEHLLGDLSMQDQELIVARGGKGGFGNAHFTSSRRQVPKFAEYGSPGDEVTLRLELRLVADVGLIGMPNAGKSTLLACATNARPKIADYPFTTLVPHLGIIRRGDTSLTLADIPGLIEGAASGKGLGHEFLRHIKRTRLIVHLIDGTSDDIVRDYRTIRHELERYDASLVGKKELVVINKIDTVSIADCKLQIVNLKKAAKAKEIFLISAVTREGVKKLFDVVFKIIQDIPIPKLDAQQEKVFTIDDVDENLFEIKKTNAGFRIYSKKLNRIAERTDFQNWQAVERIRDVIRKLGIKKALEKEGIKEVDILWIGEHRLEW